MKKRILVTDDDPGILDIFKIILEKAGYEVDVISNGLEILKNHFTIPDLFILDRQLSGVDGLDLCRFLKSRQDTAHVPVIMVSANPRLQDLSKEAGADDCLEKPFDLKNFLRMIKRYTESKLSG